MRAGWPDAGEFRYYGTADATRVVPDRAGSAPASPGWRTRAAPRRAGWRTRWTPAAGSCGTRRARRPAGSSSRAGATRSTPPPIPAAAATCAPTARIPRRRWPTSTRRRSRTRRCGRSAHGRRPEWARRAASCASGCRRSGRDVMALEAGDVPVPGAGSQLGWLLWADALEPEAAGAAAARLCEPDILTAFGLRTLAASDADVRADAYHRGAVWPFDSWLGWGGLRAAGACRPSGAPACSPRSTSSARAGALRGRAAGRSLYASRRGRSARAGRSSTLGAASSGASAGAPAARRAADPSGGPTRPSTPPSLQGPPRPRAAADGGSRTCSSTS